MKCICADMHDLEKDSYNVRYQTRNELVQEGKKVENGNYLSAQRDILPQCVKDLI